MKKFIITEEEKNSILNQHIVATKRQYLSEEIKNVQGTLKSADKTQMLDAYDDLANKIKNDNQIFVVANTEGDVAIAGNSNQLRGKLFKPTDSISISGDGKLIVYPKGNMDQQIIVGSRNGKLILFVGA